MADHMLTVKLDDYTLRKIAAAAQSSGLPAEKLAVMVLEAHFFDYDDFKWANGEPREPTPPLDPNEPTYEWEDVKAEMSARLERNRRRRA